MKRVIKGLSVLLLLAVLALPAGCSAKKSSSAPNNAAVQDRSGFSANMADQAAPLKSSTGGTASGSPGGSASAAPSTATAQAAAASRKVVYTAGLTMETTGYDKAVSGLEALVSQYGGYVQDSSTQGTGKQGSARSASFTVRIPSDRLDDFLKSAGSIGTVLTKTVKGEDVSQDYFDTETRVKTLRDEQARILDILAKTTTMSDVITIEQRLSDIETQIEQLTGQLQKWDSLVDLSTVTVSIREVAVLTESPEGFGARVGRMFRQSLSALVETLKGIALVLAAVLPFAVVIGVVILIAVLIRRAARRRRKRTAEPEKPENQE